MGSAPKGFAEALSLILDDQINRRKQAVSIGDLERLRPNLADLIAREASRAASETFKPGTDQGRFVRNLRGKIAD